MTDADRELPPGWVWTTVGGAAKAINSGFPSGEHNQEGQGIPHLRPMNISTNGDVDLAVIKSVKAEKYDALRQGDVFFNNTNSPALVGKTTYIRADSNWAYSNHMTRIRPARDIVEPGWMAHYLHHLFFSGYFQAICRNHVNQASVSTGPLSETRLPLAPLPEQRRIVSKIEELFTRLDAGVAALKRVQAALKRYRASVLKAACEGRLVPQDPADEPASALLARILAARRAKWEADQRAKGKDPKKAKYEEPQPPNTEGLLDLPEGWAWVIFDNLLLELKNGFFSGTPASGPPGIPILRISAVRPLALSFDDLRYLPEVQVESVRQYRLQEGDLLFTRYNGNLELVGACARVHALTEFVVYPDKLIRARVPNEQIEPSYLEIYFATQVPRSIIELKAKSTAGQQGISGQEIRALPVALPPLPEQRRIVAEVERRLSVVAEVEKTVADNLARAGRLRQAILARAFSGRLVPQDPNDEPAGALLVRIAAARGGEADTPARGGGAPRPARQGEASASTRRGRPTAAAEASPLPERSMKRPARGRKRQS